jgi:hypothetical protein
MRCTSCTSSGESSFSLSSGWPAEDDPEHLLLRRLDAGQQPDLLEHAVREVLGLVHDQHDLAARRVLLDQELVERRDQLGLAHLERLEAELDQHRLQEFDRRHLRLRDLRDDDVLLELAQEGLEQRRLAGADLAGDDDEAVGEPDRRLHVRLGARMVLRQVQERRVRAQPERQLVQLEVFQVHASYSLAQAQVPVPARKSTGAAARARRGPAARDSFDDSDMAEFAAGPRRLAVSCQCTPAVP